MTRKRRLDMKRLVCGLCLVAGAVSAEELPLGLDVSGRVTFGDARLRVTFDPATSFPSAITVDGNALIVPNGRPSVKINLKGSTAELSQTSPLKKLGIERVAPDTVRSRVSDGPWRIDGYLQIVPEQRAVRRWFAFEWTGTNAVKFSGFEMQMGKFRCAEEGGFYILPWRFLDNRFPRSEWKVGSRNHAIHGSESPIVAENGAGWSVLACIDCLQPYSDRSQHHVEEMNDGIALSASASMCGVAHPGKPQCVGDFWLVFRRGGAEDALRNMHAWHRLVGHLPPKDRPEWVHDLILYSTHPRGRGMSEPGGFPHAQEYIPYIKALGANAIWLRPVEHVSCYVPDEMYKLQDDVGTEADHLAYVRAAHARGLKVWRDAVMHGGKSDNRRSREHPEWVCLKEDGSQQDSYWAYDFRWPSWVKYFADYVEWTTRKYELDGWRMDVPTGSRFPNWNPNIPYDRASYAQHQGGLAQMRAIRAAMKRANPDSCTLAEANPSYCSVTCDTIHDQLLCHAYFHWFNDHPVADVVGWLSQWLEDQRNAFVPGTVWMRYPESHDAYPCDNVWGRAAANALMAFSAWIEGFPLVMNESEDGAFEAYRRIFAIRKALPELTRGSADYLSVKAPPGVFACRRSLADVESVVYVNFNGHRVTEGGLDLPPFGYTVVRTRGPSVASCLEENAKKPYETSCGNGRSGFTAELRDMTNGLVRAAYRIVEHQTADGCRYRVADFGGCDPARVRLVIRLPDVGRWYAHAAEGSFESPFLVRHPKMDAYYRYDRWMDGAVRWDSRLHPFGFTREHAAVGGVSGDTAYECFGFDSNADVRLWDRLGAEPGLAVSVSGTNAAAFAVTCAVRPSADALAPRDAGTGDPRLRPAMGGWQYEDDTLRLRIRRTGAVAGMWRKDADGAWREVLRSFGARGRAPDAPKTPRQVWGGRDPDAKEQAFSPSPYARFIRDPDGTLRLFFDGGQVRGITQNSRGMPKPIRTETIYTFAPSGGTVDMTLLFSCDGRYGKDDWTVELRAELPDGVNLDDVFANPVFTGWKPWRIFCGKNEVRYIYHDPNGPVFAPPRNWRHGISCRLGAREP